MSTQEFTTPVLLLIFNRPETTREVFEKIKELKPKYLFISADGPRGEIKNDFETCRETREIVSSVDWKCEIKTRFNDNNLGCKIGVSSGITWFFEHVNEGIILEDDCVPDISFFYFCKELLERYRNDNRIMHISGTNFQDGIIRGDGSYYFSRYVYVWGWATWKRAWELYDVKIQNYNKFIEQDIIKNIFPNKREQLFLHKNFSQVYTNKKMTWDYQWHYTNIINNGLSIVPNKNLVSNIGFGQEATHTLLEHHPFANRPVEKMDKVSHPSFMIPNIEADRYTLNKYFSPNKFIKLKLWLYQLLKK